MVDGQALTVENGMGNGPHLVRGGVLGSLLTVLVILTPAFWRR